MLVAFDAIPVSERNHVVAGVLVTHGDAGNHAPIILWVQSDGKRIDLPLNADHAYFGPVRADWIAQNLVVQSDQPRHSIEAGFGLWIAPPPARTVPLAYVRDGMKQTDAILRIGARHVGGYLAQFAAPVMHHVALTLAGCCDGTVSLDIAGAKTVLRQDKSGIVSLPDAALADGQNGTLTASADIIKIDPSS
jgi:hypothetical protein